VGHAQRGLDDGAHVDGPALLGLQARAGADLSDDGRDAGRAVVRALQRVAQLGELGRGRAQLVDGCDGLFDAQQRIRKWVVHLVCDPR
jgi:hypothetical protein